ncbi:MAG: hypothetical protein IJG36_12055 [Synergistaceae bacterium]|nr:hypothetical protein [Synergistaceae bacterium]MBQ4431452.1 hypothetical protein [Synergistaceae bacterium]MBQ7169025.1 hypothetical protein [Synergistaceae bacterium]
MIVSFRGFGGVSNGDLYRIDVELDVLRYVSLPIIWFTVQGASRFLQAIHDKADEGIFYRGVAEVLAFVYRLKNPQHPGRNTQ